MTAWARKILGASLCAAAALAVAAAAARSTDRPPGCAPENWIELQEGVGLFITGSVGSDRDLSTTDTTTGAGRAFLPKKGPELDLAAWGGVGGHLLQPGLEGTSETVQGFLMVRRNGRWHRFQLVPE